MDKIDRNGRTILLYIIMLLIIIVGGFFLIKNNKNNNNQVKDNKNAIEKIAKNDNNLDYIYFTNEKVVSEELEITNKEIIFNFESEDAKDLQTNLNNSMEQIKDSLKKISETDIPEGEEIKDIDDIYSVNAIDYEYVESNKYLSLIVSSYTYTANSGMSDKEYSYYVFDIYTGKLIGNKEIMKEENITDQQIRTKIREYINNDEAVDIDVTLNNPYYLTISKNGTIKLNFLVNRDNINYNVSIEMSD